MRRAPGRPFCPGARGARLCDALRPFALHSLDPEEFRLPLAALLLAQFGHVGFAGLALARLRLRARPALGREAVQELAVPLGETLRLPPFGRLHERSVPAMLVVASRAAASAYISPATGTALTFGARAATSEESAVAAAA